MLGFLRGCSARRGSSSVNVVLWLARGATTTPPASPSDGSLAAAPRLADSTAQ